MSGGPEGYVLLEDGARFDGELTGAAVLGTWDGAVLGEVVFNTAMTGYQEAMTDPSYAGQLITFTYPLIGNYGVSAPAMESDRVHAKAAIMREGKNSEDASSCEGGWLDWLRDCGVPAITGLDTRSLVRHIRDRGAMRGGIFRAELDQAEARERITSAPAMAGADLASTVTPGEPIEIAGGGAHIVALDTGIKQSILRQFRERDARLTLLPCTTPAEDVLRLDPDLVFLANGPGDPAALDYVVDTVRGVVGKAPVVGICLGHQLLCRAIGLDTFKLPFGHRGGNHPVKDLATGRIEITSQNHGFAVQGPGGEGRIEGDEPVRWETDFGAAELSHLNLYDRTVEGLVLRDVSGCTVQYHPEAGPGPHDARHLFDRFMEMAAGGFGVIWPPQDDELHGTIVSMRPLAEADRENLRVAGSDAAIWEWMDRRIPDDPNAFDEWFEARLAKREAGLEWGLITIATQTGEAVGSSSFLNPRPDHDGVEIGNTWLNPSAWRSGANVEAKLLMLTYAFELLGCMRVEFKTDSRNSRSRGALEALPSTFEGIFRKHMRMPITGVRDSAYYSITDEEWHASKLQLEVRLQHYTGVAMDTEVERA